MPSDAAKAMIAQMRSGPSSVGAAPSATEMRAGMEAMGGLFPLPPDVTTTPVDAGGVPAEWIVAPGAADDTAILYLHGGGYAIGSIATHRDLCARISRAAGARVLAIDYRLAPENKFPAALEDSTAAYRWLLAQGVPATRMAIAGDSAGGGLTVSTLVALRDAGDPLPAAAVCMSPWADMEATGESMTTKVDEDPIISPALIKRFADWYVQGDDLRDPLASPIHADLSGLPPLLIQVGTAETLLDDANRIAEKAREAGVDVTLEPFDGLMHVFQLFGPMLPEAQEAVTTIGAFLSKRL